MAKAKVIFADSRQLDKLLPKDSIDLILTGPPYWNEVVYSNDEEQLSKLDDYSEFLKEISKVWSGCSFVLKDGGILALWVHDLYRKTENGYKYIPFHSDLLKTVPESLILRDIYIWDRYLNRDRGKMNDSALGSRIQYVLIFQKKGNHKNQYKFADSLRKLYWQPIWYKKTTPKLVGSRTLFRLFFGLIRPLADYFDIKLGTKLKGSNLVNDSYEFSNYLTECPEDISDLLIKLFSLPGDTILDPFVGSGTTLKSAIKENRNCVGVEVNKNCENIIRQKLNNLVTFDN